MSNHNINAGAYRSDTGLSATFDIPVSVLIGGITIRTIQLDYYCRTFRMRTEQIGGGFPPILLVAYSLEALTAPVFRGDAGYHTLEPDDEPFQRFFLGDDEGPPYIWVGNPSQTTPVRVLFEYFPSAKRTGRAPMPTRRDLDFPAIDALTATVVPGI